jgi:hypothetical protein
MAIQHAVGRRHQVATTGSIVAAASRQLEDAALLFLADADRFQVQLRSTLVDQRAARPAQDAVARSIV